jgi:hypothetical protein
MRVSIDDWVGWESRKQIHVLGLSWPNQH